MNMTMPKKLTIVITDITVKSAKLCFPQAIILIKMAFAMAQLYDAQGNLVSSFNC